MPPDQEIADLERATEELEQRWMELQKASVAEQDLDRTREILDLMDLVNLRLTSLETKLNHLRAGVIRIEPASATERGAMTAALTRLSEHVVADQGWDTLVQSTRRVLDAANTVVGSIEDRQRSV